MVSQAQSKEAKDFRAYTGWPREVAADAADPAKQSGVIADTYHLLSQSRTFDEWNQTMAGDSTAEDASSGDAARIRDALGLPKRSLHP